MSGSGSVQQTYLTIEVALGTGSYGGSGQNFVKLSGYRMTADISKSGVPASNSAQIRIYGLDDSIMNQLTTAGTIPTFIRNNVVTVKAGTDPNNLSLAFVGTLVYAWADYDALPDVAFNMTALTGYLASVKPVLPSSFPGKTDVAIIMQGLANQMGYTLENNLKTPVYLSSPYLPGTARAQAIAAAAAADIFLVFEDDSTTNNNGIMAILPKNGSRGTPVPLIAPPPNGTMINYPSYIGPGLMKLKSQYNPSVRFMGNVQVQSSLVAAQGLWRVVQLDHNLSCQMPNGDWKTEIIGSKPLADAVSSS